MSGYMPTTEEVRDAYSWLDNYPYEGFVDPERENAFLRWFAEVVRVARAEGWDACVDAHREVVVAGWKVDSGIMKDTNPYKSKSEKKEQ